MDAVAKKLSVYNEFRNIPEHLYFRQETGWLLIHTFAGDEMIRAAPFDSIEIDLGALWLPD